MSVPLQQRTEGSEDSRGSMTRAVSGVDRFLRTVPSHGHMLESRTI